MGEETTITSYIGSIVKKSVAEALAEEVPKYLPKKEKRYYTIKQVCELMGIKRSTYFTRAQNGDFIIVKDGRTTKIDADDLDAKLESKTVAKHVRTRHKG